MCGYSAKVIEILTPYTNLDLSEISIKRLIEKVKKMFPDTDNKIKIVDKIPEVILNVDELKMMLAIRNLLDNAIKYSGFSKQSCEISFNISDNYLSISVTDFGRGIKEEDIPKLTNPFYRADRENNVKGFGIGLTIVKKVAEAHNGELIIQSQYEKGATFILKIPCESS